MGSRDTGESGRAAGMRGLVALLRGLPARLRRPESMLMLMALMASLGAHMPPYMGLGALAEYFDQQEAAQARAAPVEVEFISEPSDPADPKPSESDVDVDEPDEREQEHRADKLEPEEVPEPKLKEPEPEPEPEKKPEPKKKEAVAQLELEQPSPQQKRLQSVTQRSENPDDPPPADAKFLAEENRTVAEESVARVRSDARNDPEPQAGDSAPAEATEAEMGDEQEQQGEEQEQPSQALAHMTPSPRPPEPQHQAHEHRPAREARPEVEPSRSEQRPERTVIEDPLGSFSLAAAEQPRKRRRAREASQRRTGARKGQRGQPDINVSWEAFEQTYSAEQLAAERARPQRRRSGKSRQKRWREFRAAIENYVPGVRPGNTTALNARADPFAAYIASFHRHLHREFARRFLGSLPSVGELADTRLVTKVEIVVNEDGMLDRVGIVKSSGHLMYDFGAYNAVHRAAPYPRPPKGIRSADGRVYLRWALHRNHEQCGTWNAEPYIVTNPPDVQNQGLPSPPRPKPKNPRKSPAAPPPASPRSPQKPVRPGEKLG